MMGMQPPDLPFQETAYEIFCTICGFRCRESDIVGDLRDFHCPKCHSQGVAPCPASDDAVVEVNWRELEILTGMAMGYLASDPKYHHMFPMLQGIANRIEYQFPEKAAMRPLTKTSAQVIFGEHIRCLKFPPVIGLGAVGETSKGRGIN